ncbi:hypothetical protein [Clostridium pasteurianum]|uniref:Uncharacterized protein n=1 Tax=Clostridium pasteurianum BC1 TaxID=86416 RepID=R4K0P9_CLOPA|nr:hypothetical protein [Clostridium pasteurianum]AGK96662.1 hypothetical protein Clopa_1744 [Clostridium pasteurianum BC1]
MKVPLKKYPKWLPYGTIAYYRVDTEIRGASRQGTYSSRWESCQSNI